MNTNNGASMQRSAQPHANITLYEKPVSRDVRAFVSEDDGISRSESLFGYISSGPDKKATVITGNNNGFCYNITYNLESC